MNCLKCYKQLRSNNTIGYCRTHRHLSQQRMNYKKDYYQTHKEELNDWQRKYDEDNREQKTKYQLSYQKEYYQKNKEEIAIYNKNWRQVNPSKINAYAAEYAASKLQRTPPWLTKEQLKEIEQFYTEAKELSWLSNGGLEVDHIVPLQGRNVSGLHVPWNLQIIPTSDNRVKSNRF